MRRACVAFGLSIGLASTAFGQDAARERVAREAASQAARADDHFKNGRFVEALSLYEAERKSRADIGDARYEAYALRGIACCLARLGRGDEAVEPLKEARTLDLKSDDKGLAGYDALLLGRTLSQLGEPAQAVDEARFALARFTDGRDVDHAAESRLLLAQALLALDRLDEAERELDAGLAAAETLDKPALQAEAWTVAGRIDFARGRLGSAFERLDDARRSLIELGRPEEAIRLDLEIADVLVGLDRLDAAETTLEAATTALEANRDPGAGEARLALSALRLDLDNPKGAAEDAEAAAELFRATGDKPRRIEALVASAQALELAKDRDRAYERIAEAAALGARTFVEAPEEEIRIVLLAARAAFRLKKRDEVERLLTQAREAAARSSDSKQKAAVEAAARSLKP